MLNFKKSKLAVSPAYGDFLGKWYVNDLEGDRHGRETKNSAAKQVKPRPMSEFSSCMARGGGLSLAVEPFLINHFWLSEIF